MTPEIKIEGAFTQEKLSNNIEAPKVFFKALGFVIFVVEI